MVFINYIDKSIEPLILPNVKASVISYEINKSDMDLLANISSDGYELRRFVLYKDWGTFDLVVDNIENGRILIGGLKEGKYILNQYIIDYGINELLQYLKT